MRDFSDALELTRKRIADAAAYLKIEELRARRPLLETEASRPDLWDDPDGGPAGHRRAGGGRRRPRALRAPRRASSRTPRRCTSWPARRTTSRQEAEIEAALAVARPRAAAASSCASMFSGEHDERDALCTIQAGEGGADAQDWAEMLLPHVRALGRATRASRSRRRGPPPGSEAGVVVGRVPREGPLRLRLPAGRARRAPPRADEPVQRPGQAPDGVRRPRRRAGAPRGRGARSRSTTPTSRWTSSARRAPAASTSTRRRRRCASPTCPPGIVVSCQVERRQFQNRDRAMAMLKARLADLERQKREAELAGIRGEQQRVGLRQPDPQLRACSRTRW